MLDGYQWITMASIDRFGRQEIADETWQMPSLTADGRTADLPGFNFQTRVCDLQILQGFHGCSKIGESRWFTDSADSLLMFAPQIEWTHETSNWVFNFPPNHVIHFHLVGGLFGTFGWFFHHLIHLQWDFPLSPWFFKVFCTTNQSFLSHPRSFWGSHGEFDQDLSFAFPFGWLLLDALHCRSAVPGREAFFRSADFFKVNWADTQLCVRKIKHTAMSHLCIYIYIIYIYIIYIYMYHIYIYT